MTGEQVPDDTARVPQWRYGGARKAQWPQADFIVGNPPFIGAAAMRDALGDGYTEALRQAWQEVPDSADFVMFWWQHAAAQVAAGHTRRVVQAALDAGTHLHFAIADHPWVDSANGAAVRIAMSVLSVGAGEGQLLRVVAEQAGTEGEVAVTLVQQMGLMHADLRVGANVAGAKALIANDNLCFEGVKPHGMGFVVTEAEALELGLGKVPGLESTSATTATVVT